MLCFDYCIFRRDACLKRVGYQYLLHTTTPLWQTQPSTNKQARPSTQVDPWQAVKQFNKVIVSQQHRYFHSHANRHLFGLLLLCSSSMATRPDVRGRPHTAQPWRPLRPYLPWVVQLPVTTHHSFLGMIITGAALAAGESCLMCGEGRRLGE